MRVTFVTRRLEETLGGASGSLDLLARSLQERGHEVRVVTFKPKLNNVPNDPAYEILEPPQRFASKRVAVNYRLYQLLDRYADCTDVYHLWTPAAIPGAGTYRSRDGTVPVVARLNSYLLFCTNQDRMDNQCYKNCTSYKKFRHEDRSLAKKIAKVPLYLSRTWIEPRLTNQIDRFFALSPAVKEVHAENGVDPDLMSVVPNFYDPSFGEGVGGDHTGEKFTMMFAGRIKDAKGLDVFIDALGKLDGPFHAYIAGEGSEKERLIERVSSETFAGDIEFLDWLARDKVAAHLGRSDVYVHPPLWPDPFPRAVIEAMQMGAVPVVSDVGGPPWAVGEAGRVFDYGDPVHLARILTELRDDPELLSGLRAAVPDRLQQFSKERVLPEIEAEYDDLVGSTS